MGNSKNARRFALRVTPSAAVLTAGLLLLAALRGRGALPLMAVAGVALAALLHEGGHILMAAACGVGLSGLRLDLYGARLGLSGLISYRQELWVSLGGPLANLLTVLLLLPLWRSWGCPVYEGGMLPHGAAGFLSILLPASAGLCAVNLLPVATLDGGRILSCALAQWVGEGVARTAGQVCTAVCAGGLWLLSAYALLRAGQQLSLFVFSFTLLLRCLQGEPTGGKN